MEVKKQKARYVSFEYHFLIDSTVGPLFFSLFYAHTALFLKVIPAYYFLCVNLRPLSTETRLNAASTEAWSKMVFNSFTLFAMYSFVFYPERFRVGAFGFPFFVFASRSLFESSFRSSLKASAGGEVRRGKVSDLLVLLFLSFALTVANALFVCQLEVINLFLLSTIALLLSLPLLSLYLYIISHDFTLTYDPHIILPMSRILIVFSSTLLSSQSSASPHSRTRLPGL